MFTSAKATTMIDPKDQQNKKARPTDRRTGFALISDKTVRPSVPTGCRREDSGQSFAA